MKLFLPSARATNYLLIVGFCSLGYALYVRYLGIEQANVGLACAAGLDTWLCSRAASPSRFTRTRSSAGPRSRLPRSICCGRHCVLFGLALALACFGIVLYNIQLSALAFGLLALSLARRAPEPE